MLIAALQSSTLQGPYSSIVLRCSFFRELSISEADTLFASGDATTFAESDDTVLDRRLPRPGPDTLRLRFR